MPAKGRNASPSVPGEIFVLPEQKSLLVLLEKNTETFPVSILGKGQLSRSLTARLRALLWSEDFVLHSLLSAGLCRSPLGGRVGPLPVFSLGLPCAGAILLFSYDLKAVVQPGCCCAVKIHQLRPGASFLWLLSFFHFQSYLY